jgi:hypothetical protein
MTPELWVQDFLDAGNNNFLGKGKWFFLPLFYTKINPSVT